MSLESVMPSNHLILCCPLLLLSSIFPSVRVFSNESVLHIRWPKYWSFSFNISPSSEYSGLISFRMDWLYLLEVQGTLKSLLQHHSSKASILWCSAFFIVEHSHPSMTTGKTIALTRRTFVGLFDLRPNCGGGNEKVPCTHCSTQCPEPCSRPPLTHASTRLSWTLMGKSGLVSCGVTAPFSWVHARFCLCPSSVCFPSPV